MLLAGPVGGGSLVEAGADREHRRRRARRPACRADPGADPAEPRDAAVPGLLVGRQQAVEVEPDVTASTRWRRGSPGWAGVGRRAPRPDTGRGPLAAPGAGGRPRRRAASASARRGAGRERGHRRRGASARRRRRSSRPSAASGRSVGVTRPSPGAPGMRRGRTRGRGGEPAPAAGTRRRRRPDPRPDQHRAGAAGACGLVGRRVAGRRSSRRARGRRPPVSSMRPGPRGATGRRRRCRPASARRPAAGDRSLRSAARLGPSAARPR